MNYVNKSLYWYRPLYAWWRDVSHSWKRETKGDVYLINICVTDRQALIDWLILCIAGLFISRSDLDLDYYNIRVFHLLMSCNFNLLQSLRHVDFRSSFLASSLYKCSSCLIRRNTKKISWSERLLPLCNFNQWQCLTYIHILRGVKRVIKAQVKQQVPW